VNETESEMAAVMYPRTPAPPVEVPSFDEGTAAKFYTAGLEPKKGVPMPEVHDAEAAEQKAKVPTAEKPPVGEPPVKEATEAPRPAIADPELVKAYQKLTTELAIDETAGAQLMERLGPMIAERVEAMRSNWANDTKADAELTAGDGFDANLLAAKGVIAKFGDAELKALLNSSGIGDHKAVVKFVAKVAKELASRLAPQQSLNQPVRISFDDAAAAEQLYGPGRRSTKAATIVSEGTAVAGRLYGRA
jgi:hypothetical protein